MQKADFSVAPPGFPMAYAPVLGAKKRRRGFPVLSAALLVLMLTGCLFAEVLMTHDPSFMNLASANAAPCAAFLFGTDPMGRDIFSMLWYGGRISLFIGLGAAAISLAIAVVYGSISGIAPAWLDDAMMRLVEIAVSIPSILIVVLVQAFAGERTPLSLAVVIGVTGWMNLAKIVRAEVRQLRVSGYVLAARCMNSGFFHLLRRHLLPSLVAPLMFMAVTGIGSAIASEATLSFLGIGLPLEIVSWGSMLALADRAVLTGSWWVFVIPGLFLVLTLVCFADLGNYIRRENNRGCNNL